MALTEKMKSFCRAYITNGGNATKAYLTAYDWTGSNNGAEVEARTLLKRDDVSEYLRSLALPMENQAVDEAARIRQIIWDRIAACIESGDDAAIARYTDQLNRLGGRYTNVNVNKTDTTVNLENIDLNALRTLSEQS